MRSSHRLAELFRDAAHGRFPPPDGALEVIGSPPGPSDAVVAFTAHTIVAAGVDPAAVRANLDLDDLGAPVSAAALVWLGQQLGSEPGMLDAVLAANGQPDGPVEALKLVAAGDSHPRTERARRYRSDVRAYSDAHQQAVVMLGHGLAGRLEVSFEVASAARGAGLATRLLRGARRVAGTEPLFAQVSPGNAASLRALLAAGFVPIGAEVLFLRR